MKRRHSLFGRLLIIFFGAAIAVVGSIMISFHFLADKPYRKSFNRNIVTYTRLIVDKVRFDPFAKEKIEKQAGVKISTKLMDIRRKIALKDLHFRPISDHISITKPGRKFFIKYDDGFSMILIEVHNQEHHPESIDAILVGLLAALLILLLAYHLVQKTFKPIDKIQELAKEFGAGHMQRRLPVEGKGQLSSLTVSINDLADRIESMLDAKRSLFLAIGHELKTPLARMRLQVEMLDGKTQPVIRNINEMTTIIDQLLEAERVTHHSELNLEDHDLKNILEEFNDDVVEVTVEKEINYKFDKIRLELAIKNLVQNSKKYAPDSKIKIHQTVHNNEIEISISDNGPGINAADMDQLTDAFFRPDTSRTRDAGGVGLGLYLVKNIVEAHRGVVSFENTHPGFKTTISLPIS